MGTATPSNCINQADYPDYYFRVTNCEHMTNLKQKFKRMGEKSMIKKRYIHLIEEFLKENPNMCTYMAPSSLDVRQDIMVWWRGQNSEKKPPIRLSKNRDNPSSRSPTLSSITLAA
ncbi:hypothetical protein K1719_039106 [Acacia pycnantha]|nr:hypothetical protein K1719_039106 [Acacia pycnantha]